MSGTGRRVDPAALEAFVASLFAAAGTPEEDARLIAEVLVWANLRGVDSHGVLRIPGYIRRIATGEFNPRPAMAVLTETPAAVVLDCDRAYGPVGMTRAMDLAIEKARAAGIGVVFARRVTHVAAIGHYALRAAAADMIGLVLATSRPNMAYHGAKAAGVATSPIAIAVPGMDHAPVVLDMATSVGSVGKMMYARDSGLPLEPGMALDKSGEPTTDAAKAALQMPLGGPKGAGLALMFECLTGVLVGNPVISTALGPPHAWGHNQNAMAMAIDIAAFTEPARYRRDIDALVAALKSLPVAAGIDEILVPGERGDRVLAERSRDGVPVPSGTWDRLAELAGELGVAMPETVPGHGGA